MLFDFAKKTSSGRCLFQHGTIRMAPWRAEAQCVKVLPETSPNCYKLEGDVALGTNVCKLMQNNDAAIPCRCGLLSAANATHDVSCYCSPILVSSTT